MAMVMECKNGCRGPRVLVLLSCLMFGSSALAAEQIFASPEAAIDGLVAAVRAADEKAMLVVLGDKARGLIDSGDPVADRRAREKFVAEYDTAHSLVEVEDTRQVLQIGQDHWPFPIPVVREAEGWRFDTDAGDDELLARRIGKNELSAIQACLAYADAQREYSIRNPTGDGVPQYAQRLVSTTGKHDGLYWETSDDEPPSPLGPLFGAARDVGYEFGDKANEGAGSPYFGYFYRILTAQGANANGGAYDYLVGEKMIGGFALVAYPAHYEGSGIMTFLTSHDGVVFEKDLGPSTEEIAKAMKTFDPDGTWTRVAEEEEEGAP